MTVERYLHGLWSVVWLDRVAAATAEYGLYVCVLVLLAAWLRRRPSGILLPFAIGAVGAIALDVIAGVVYHDQRPFVTLGVAPLIPHGSDNGFPSDHSAAVAFIAVAALFIDAPLGILASIVAISLGIARLFCLLHSPIDVFAGWLIGAIPALGAGLVWTQVRRRSNYSSTAREYWRSRGGRP